MWRFDLDKNDKILLWYRSIFWYKKQKKFPEELNTYQGIAYYYMLYIYYLSFRDLMNEIKL
jgi:hypothetical protein